MSQNLIIELYTDLATNPDKDFGWETGLQNAKNHNRTNNGLMKFQIKFESIVQQLETHSKQA